MRTYINRVARNACLVGVLVTVVSVASNGISAPVLMPVFGPPEAKDNLNGNSWFTPFDRAEPARFQQVFDLTTFESIANGGAFIYGVSFRVDATVGHSFLATIPSFQLDLSTTSMNSDALSPSFDLNVGMDNLTVIGPSSITLAGAGGAGIGFHVNFVWSDPYFYDPAKGNLLLDFRVYQGIGHVGGPPQGVAVLDAFDVVGDSVSSVYGFGSTMPNSGQVSSLGLATAIRLQAVPEPSMLSLMAVGLAIMGGICWKRTRKERKGSLLAEPRDPFNGKTRWKTKSTMPF